MRKLSWKKSSHGSAGWELICAILGGSWKRNPWKRDSEYSRLRNLYTYSLIQALLSRRSVVLCTPFGFVGFYFLFIDLRMGFLETYTLRNLTSWEITYFWCTVSIVEVPFCEAKRPQSVWTVRDLVYVAFSHQEATVMLVVDTSFFIQVVRKECCCCIRRQYTALVTNTMSGARLPPFVPQL